MKGLMRSRTKVFAWTYIRIPFQELQMLLFPSKKLGLAERHQTGGFFAFGEEFGLHDFERYDVQTKAERNKAKK
jgi:hypothetical protein